MLQDPRLKVQFQQPKPSIELFVVNLAKYTTGNVDAGKWFDMDLYDKEDIMKELFGVDEDGDAKIGDYAIHDVETKMGVVNKYITEYSDLDDIHEFSRWLSKLTLDETVIFLAICEAADTHDIEELMRISNECEYIWLGDCDNMDDAGESYYKELYGTDGIPEHVWGYFDFARWAEDNTGIVHTKYGYIEVREG